MAFSLVIVPPSAIPLPIIKKRYLRRFCVLRFEAALAFNIFLYLGVLDHGVFGGWGHLCGAKVGLRWALLCATFS